MSNLIVIIGGGNMGGAIATYWQQANLGEIHVIERDDARRAALAALGIHCHTSLADAPPASVYLLAIKPQQFAAYGAELKAALQERVPLLISIMAGITLADLQAITPRAVRVMPNLPAMIGESMSVLCAPDLDADARQNASDLFAAIGAIAWVEEEAQLHAVTAISGSGPGYVFAFMEALHSAAIAQGLAPDLARLLVQQTLRGAALLADQSPEDAATLRAQVTSKGGTTEAALFAFTQGHFHELVAHAVAAATQRSVALSQV